MKGANGILIGANGVLKGEVGILKNEIGVLNGSIQKSVASAKFLDLNFQQYN